MSSSETQEMIDDLLEWLRIPSISTGGGDPAEIRRAAEWAIERIKSAGGTAELIENPGNPIVYGELRAARADAPTVLLYGHYDVQGPGDLSLWDSPPFEPTIRDGKIYARGTADDKGNFLPLFHAACTQAKAGELDVHVRFVIEGEEEAGSEHVIEWILNDTGPAACAVVFDSGMVNAQTPAVALGTRGLVVAKVKITTGLRDLHSGMFGGAALNAVMALHQTLAAVMPGPDGVVPEPLRVGAAPPTAEEIEAWKTLPSGLSELEGAGTKPADATAAEEFYLRTTARTAVDITGIGGGDPVDGRTITPAVARAVVSVRTIPHQNSSEIQATLERMLSEALPVGADMEIEWNLAEPSFFDPKSAPIQLAREAWTGLTPNPPALIRGGGTLPIFSAFMERGIEVICSGVSLPEDTIHAPNESIALDRLELGLKAAHSLLRTLAQLPA